MNVSVHCKFFFLAVCLKFSIIKCWGENIHSGWWSEKRLKVSKAEKGTSWRLLQSPETSFCQQRSIWSKYGFSRSHIQMWQSDHKEGWALKNWSFWIVMQEKTLKSPLDLQGDQTNQSWRKSTLNIHWKDWCWNWSSNTLATWLEEPTHWKRPWCWARLRTKGEGAAENEMVRWHHWLNGHEFEQAPGDDEGQGSPVCYSPWGHKELDMT